MEKRPLLQKYYEGVRKELDPHYQEAHSAVYKVAKKNFGLSR
jgi:hypothetical protein